MEEKNQTLTPEESLRALIESSRKYGHIPAIKGKKSSSGKSKMKDHSVESSDISPSHGHLPAVKNSSSGKKKMNDHSVESSDPLPSHGIKLEEQPVAPEGAGGNISPKGEALMLFASRWAPTYQVFTNAAGNEILIGVIRGPDCAEYDIDEEILPEYLMSDEEGEVDDPIPGRIF